MNKLPLLYLLNILFDHDGTIGHFFYYFCVITFKNWKKCPGWYHMKHIPLIYHKFPETWLVNSFIQQLFTFLNNYQWQVRKSSHASVDYISSEMPLWKKPYFAAMQDNSSCGEKTAPWKVLVGLEWLYRHVQIGMLLHLLSLIQLWIECCIYLIHKNIIVTIKTIFVSGMHSSFCSSKYIHISC